MLSTKRPSYAGVCRAGSALGDCRRRGVDRARSSAALSRGVAVVGDQRQGSSDNRRTHRAMSLVPPRTRDRRVRKNALFDAPHRGSLERTIPTRSSAIAEGPRDASCQLKYCQLLYATVQKLLYDKSGTKYQLSLIDPCDKIVL